MVLLYFCIHGLLSNNLFAFVVSFKLYFLCQCLAPSLSPWGGGFSYVGHGAGARFLDSQSVLKQQMRAASLLFGCSSAALAVRGDLEAHGIILNYLMSGW